MTNIVDFNKILDTTVLKGKCALVTGGASGLRAKTASLLSSHGALVTIADINAELGEKYAAETTVKSYCVIQYVLYLICVRVHFVHSDVTSWDSQVNAFKEAIAFAGVGTIDIVAAVAGMTGKPFEQFHEEARPSLEVDPVPTELFDRTIDVNLKGVYYTSQLARYYFGLPSTSNANHTVRKSLTLVGSSVGYCDFRLSADYSASKWGVRGIFRAIRTAMEEQGYRVNLIAPWIMDTPIIDQLRELFAQNEFPIGDPKDVADTIVRCAADDTVLGRAIYVGSSTICDLRDDPEGSDGAIETKKYLQAEGKNWYECYKLL